MNHLKITIMKKHHYTKISHWKNPDNWFWETEKHTEKAKRYFRKWLSKLLNVGAGQDHKLDTI